MIPNALEQKAEPPTPITVVAGPRLVRVAGHATTLVVLAQPLWKDIYNSGAATENPHI